MNEGIFKFGLGVKAKDTITGYEGVIMGRTEYLTGCCQYGLLKQQLTNEGKIPAWVWFDESRLEAIPAKPVEVDENSEPGGPAPSAPEC